ncbi:MAG TPA: M24 family metallopeptidase [Candidatus Gallacutalibacter pullistercoris]|nr:M24 family metallopeptidase [Candidatus Gallacutalibacter pullistercoris]
MTVNEKIAALRGEMAKANVDALIIPTSDPHMSEYIPEAWKARKEFSGFTGSAGTLVITTEESGLWTDGRYFIQAEAQLSGSEIKLFRMREKGVPTVEEYLADTQAGKTVAVDGTIYPAASGLLLQEKLEKVGASLVSEDLVMPVWENRPELPHTPAYVLDVKYAGLSPKEKLQQVREQLAEKNADAQLYSTLDCANWLSNVRASDIAYNPFATSYVLVLKDEARLYLDEDRLSAEDIACLKKTFILRPYAAITEDLSGDLGGAKMLVNKAAISYDNLLRLMKNGTVSIVYGTDVVEALKGVKNPTELKNIRQAHVWDGVALANFWVKLQNRMEAGEAVSEYDVCLMLSAERAKMPENRGDSFDTIAGYGPNAAMMHYGPTAEKSDMLQKKGFLLIDSGGQYLTGTTDVTRTFVMGPISEEEKTDFTRVLKSHIQLAMAVFPEGTKDGMLDCLARQQVWKYGLDYRCGTGHGVGFFGGVHEGPQNFSQRSSGVLKEGMTITNEPGLYLEGKYGIRTENLLEVVFWKETEYGRFLKMEPLTLFPVDRKAIDVELMTREELDYLNDYHQKVYKALAPHVEPETLPWLEEACQAL